MKNKIGVIINSLCGMWWCYGTYVSITTEDIKKLKTFAIIGSILSVLLFTEHAYNSLKK